MVSCLRRKTEQQRLGKEEMERNYYVCFALIVTFSVIRTTICCHLFLIILLSLHAHFRCFPSSWTLPCWRDVICIETWNTETDVRMQMSILARWKCNKVLLWTCAKCLNNDDRKYCTNNKSIWRNSHRSWHCAVYTQVQRSWLRFYPHQIMARSKHNNALSLSVLPVFPPRGREVDNWEHAKGQGQQWARGQLRKGFVLFWTRQWSWTFQELSQLAFIMYVVLQWARGQLHKGILLSLSKKWDNRNG